MKITPTRQAHASTKRIQQVRKCAVPDTETDTSMDRLLECLEIAFPPIGTRAAPAALVLASTSGPQDRGLTEISFGKEVPGPGGERRHESRERLSIYRTATVRWGKFEALCLIRDISSGGLMGKLHVDLMPGENVTVEIRSGSLIAGRIAWSANGSVGIAFDAPIEVLEVLHAPHAGKPGLKQRMPRVRVSCPVSLLVDGNRHQVTLVDVSQGGAKLAADNLREGDEVFVTIRGLSPHRALVRWTRDGYAGVTFLSPIPFDPLARWALEQQACLSGRA
ncbi:MAG: PilZ domain-containing protein [Alphaproteobacteria bacterium]|nr:MAG: PilZ domain-containing protein [Alphaproteobacteria bacterium]